LLNFNLPLSKTLASQCCCFIFWSHQSSQHKQENSKKKNKICVFFDYSCCEHISHSSHRTPTMLLICFIQSFRSNVVKEFKVHVVSFVSITIPKFPSFFIAFACIKLICFFELIFLSLFHKITLHFFAR